jgi:radical SAM superfamily enzyme YgiQ (UPF0313 family)
MKVMFVYGAFENLGIEYLSAVLKSNGHSTRLAFDPKLFNDPFIRIGYLARIFDYERNILGQIKDYNPGMVVFSVVAADYRWAVGLSAQIKKQMPSVHITFGGIHPSSVPEKVLENDCVDSVVIGEGEYPLLELTDSLEKGRPDSTIKNIWFKEKGQIIKNRLRPYVDNLDSLPFPDKELYYDVIPQYKSGYTILTRRGCINSCSYCHNTIWQMNYPGEQRIRFRSVGNVILELKNAKKKYNFKRLRINDDLFTCNEDWLNEFSGEYKKYINVPVYCFGSPNTINENVMRCLKKIGCYQVCLGAQSISPSLRKNILNRNETNEKISDAIKLCRKYKIRCTVDNIIGLPGEKDEDLLEMAKFYNENRPDRACIFWLIYFPGTPIINKALEYRVFPGDRMELAEKEPCDTANTLQGRIHPKEKIKYQWLLFILHFCPRKIYSWIIVKKIYNFFPDFSPSIAEAVFTMLAKDRLDIPRRRYYVRYFYFIKKLLCNKTGF